jgi:hypothetical protein
VLDNEVGAILEGSVLNKHTKLYFLLLGPREVPSMVLGNFQEARPTSLAVT